MVIFCIGDVPITYMRRSRRIRRFSCVLRGILYHIASFYRKQVALNIIILDNRYKKLI